MGLVRFASTAVLPALELLLLSAPLAKPAGLLSPHSASVPPVSTTTEFQQSASPALLPASTAPLPSHPAAQPAAL